MNTNEQTLPSRTAPSLLHLVLRNRIPYHIVRLVLAASFIVAALYKFGDLDAFAGTIGAFGILPTALVDWTALLLPITELFAGLALAFDIRGGLAVVTTLIALFITVLAYGLALGLDIDCGCYGPGDPEAGTFSSLRTSLYRDFGLLGLAGYCQLWRLTNNHRAYGFRDIAKRLHTTTP